MTDNMVNFDYGSVPHLLRPSRRRLDYWRCSPTGCLPPPDRGISVRVLELLTNDIRG
jgi:hypothetical protein